MGAEVDRAPADKLTTIDGICAYRVCKPTILVTFGYWSPNSLTRSLRDFIGDYNPDDYRGLEVTLCAFFS